MKREKIKNLFIYGIIISIIIYFLPILVFPLVALFGWKLGELFGWKLGELLGEITKINFKRFSKRKKEK